MTPLLVGPNETTTVLIIELLNKGYESHWIQPGCIIGELQAVQYADTSNMTPEETKNIFFFHQFKLSDLSDAKRNQVNELLVEFKDIFSEGNFDIGRATSTTHDIHLSEEKPFKIRHRRIPPGMSNDVKEHLKQLKNTGIIRDSASPWSSPVVLVRKSNGDLRMCVDYRELNKRMIKDSYALPRMRNYWTILVAVSTFLVLTFVVGTIRLKYRREIRLKLHSH